MRKRQVILIIGIIFLVIVLLGSTFAFFTYYKNSEAFSLSSGDIKIKYTSGTNNISLTNAYPLTDDYAIENLDRLGYIDFIVDGSITSNGNETIDYEIYLTEDSNNTLDSNYIKLYLTDNEKKSYIEPVIFGKLSETTNPNGKGKVIYEEQQDKEFKREFRIYMWIDSEYEQNEVSESFGFKVNLYAYNGEKTPTAVDTLIEKVENEEDGIKGIKPETGEICQNDCKEYRYTGPTVKNYVQLKNKQSNDESDTEELWRIIGVFTDEETGEKYIRLVRNEVLPEAILPATYVKNGTTYTIQSTDSNKYYAYWNKNDSENQKNTWKSAGLQYYLNGEEDASGNKGYVSYLSKETKSLLEERKHYLGTFIYDTDTAVSGYKNERDVLSCAEGKGAASSFPTAGCNVWSGNDATWEGSISLMYPSDYGFSADKQYWNTIKLDEGGYNIEAKDTSWMYTTMPDAKNIYSWMVTPSSAENNGYSSGLNKAGCVRYHYWVNDSRNIGGARPVLNLASQVKISSGAGTEVDPYILEI